MSHLFSLLLPLADRESTLEAGAALFHQGDQVERLHLVRTGTVRLSRVDDRGLPAVMQRAGPSGIVAEGSIFSETYHCDAAALTEARTCSVNMRILRQTLADRPELLEAVACHLARELQQTRGRVEVLSRKTVSDRLSAWLAINGGTLPPRGSLKSAAEDLGVSPEAFYRELSRRRILGESKGR
jgi:CRP-like cAMP-binding protein